MNQTLVSFVGKPHVLFFYPRWYDIIRFGPQLRSLPLNLDFFNYIRTLALYEATIFQRGPQHHFVGFSNTRLSMNQTLIPLVGKPHGPFFYSRWYDIVHFRPKPSSLPSNQDFLHCIRALALREATICRGAHIIILLGF